MGELLGSPVALLILLGLLVVTLVVTIVLFFRYKRNTFATPLEKATFGTLHTVALAAPALREGLSKSSAEFALPYLRTLLETCALAMTDGRPVTTTSLARASTSGWCWSASPSQASTSGRPSVIASAQVSSSVRR